MPFEETVAPDFGVQVHESRRDRVGEEDDDERGQRDQDRPVDRAEQEEHEDSARDQELGVEVGEDFFGVDREAEVAGEQHLEAILAAADLLAHVLTPVRGLLEVGGDDQGGEGERLVRGDRGRSVAGGSRVTGGSAWRVSLPRRYHCHPPPQRRHGSADQRQVEVSSVDLLAGGLECVPVRLESSSTASASSSIFSLSASVRPPSR